MSVKDFISGTWLRSEVLTKRAPSFIYIVILVVIYIYNVFNVQHLYRRVSRLQSEISRLEVTSTTIQTKRVSVTRQTYIMGQIEKRGLPIFEPETPPKTIK